MTKEELAARLDGREYRNEMTTILNREAKEAGLVVIFGASDDLMEFRGAVYDERGCWEGGTVYFTNKGLLTNKCEDEDCSYFKEAEMKAVSIKAIWDTGGYSWTYKTAIPHATFDIMEDDEKYCRGIVFALADVEDTP